jgi:uncharacterized metal-binding protein
MMRRAAPPARRREETMRDAKTLEPSCASCSAVQAKLATTSCSSGPAANAPPRPGHCPTSTQAEIVEGALAVLRGDGEDARLARVAARVEGLGYERSAAGAQARWTRVEDTIAFAKLMGYRRIGIATCVGLLQETGQLCEILEAHGLEPISVCCKCGSADKCEVGVPDGDKIRPGKFEPACNPIAQARICNELGTDLNVMVGLCVGHDALFNRHSKAPVTTLITKDRVTGHNPAAPLYGRHYYRRLRSPLPIPAEEA